MENGTVVAVSSLSSWGPRLFWWKRPHSDPRVPTVQIPKEKKLRVQITELYKMRPEPKNTITMLPGYLFIRLLGYLVPVSL